jgi:ribosome-binding protein aMBF1 (putative translation factor)
LYDLRSGIVHGGGKRPSSDDVRTLFNYVHRAIERAISLRQLSKKELIARLEETQLPKSSA